MGVTIEKLDHEGRGIGKISGKTVFVPKALPGETVRIRIDKEKKNYIEASLEEIVKPSTHRREPICPYFNDCGGCDIMHLSYLDQLEYKQEKVTDIMRKFARIPEEKIKKIRASHEDLYYRNKVTFQVRNGVIGLFQKESNDVVSIDGCYIVNPKMNRILEKLKKQNLDGIKQVVIRTDSDSPEAMVIFYLSQNRSLQQVVEAIKSDVTSIIEVVENEERVLYGSKKIVFELGRFQFELSPTAFFQVNTSGCKQLYDVIKEYAKIEGARSILDLYCGVGTISIYLSDLVKSGCGIEYNAKAIEDANVNKRINHCSQLSYISGDAGKVISKIKDTFDLIVVDPPRKGLDKKTVCKLLDWNTPSIIYVSCDPVTLARDLVLLSEKFDVVEITPVDMFPQTAHVECVCLLKRKGE